MTDIVERLRSDTPNMTEGHAAMHEAAAEITRLRAKVAKADALAEAHGKLWSALAEIVEAPGMAPNATVRRMAARAEKALIEDTITDVRPVPRFYREADT